MLFDREALEMASHEAVARYHASLFPGDTIVADLTCGIGGDLIAIARRGPVHGFDLNADRLRYAQHNLASHHEKAQMSNQDSTERIDDFEYVLLDPARRVDGRRTLHIAEFLPNPLELLDQLKATKLAVIKLSPMIANSDLIELGGGTRFVSYGGECREVLVLLGKDAPHDWSAVHIETETRAEGNSDLYLPEPGEIADEYIFEVDPALIRAHGVRKFTEDHRLQPLGASLGYLTGPAMVSSPWITGHFRTQTTLKLDRKAVRAWIRNSGANLDAIKAAGEKFDPRKLEIELNEKGSHSRKWIGIVYKAAGNVQFSVCERLPRI